MEEVDGKINGIALHPNKPHVAIVGNTPVCKIYDLVEKKYLAFIPLPGPGTHATFSRTGTFLATATFDPEWVDGKESNLPSPFQVCIWNAADMYRLVKSDTYNKDAVIKQMCSRNNWQFQRVRDEMGGQAQTTYNFIRDKYYKLHMSEIISLQFLNVVVEYPATKDRAADERFGEIEVLFSGSKDDLLRFWEFNPRHDAIHTIPCEQNVDYGQGVRYLASLRHMDRVETSDGKVLRHEKYTAVKVSSDGRILCTLDSNSLTAGIAKLAYEQMMYKEDQKFTSSGIPRDSERTISFPLMVHRFQPNVEMLDLDFMPTREQRPGIESAGDTNKVVGSYTIVFGGRGINGAQSCIESICVKAAATTSDAMLAGESVMSNQKEYSPFILENSGVLGGSVKRRNMQISTKTQVSNNREVMTQVLHSYNMSGSIHRIVVSDDGVIVSGDEYQTDDSVSHVVSVWTQIPGGFSRSSIGHHTNQIESLSCPTEAVAAQLRAALALEGRPDIFITSGLATVQGWKLQQASEKKRALKVKSEDMDKITDRIKPIITIEQQLTNQQKAAKEKAVKVISELKKELEPAPVDQSTSTERKRKQDEKFMRSAVLKAKPTTEAERLAILRRQEEMFASEDAADALDLLKLDEGKEEDNGLVNFALLLDPRKKEQKSALEEFGGADEEDIDEVDGVTAGAQAQAADTMPSGKPAERGQCGCVVS